MAALDFPSTPADNEIFRAPNGATWKWDDTRGLWISVGGVAKRRVSRFIGIAGDDTLSVVYNVGQIDVYYNGVKLDPDTDFTATNGTSVVLTDAVTDDSDIIETIAWSNFDITEGLDITEGDARYSPITRSRKNLLINGDFQVWQRGSSFTNPTSGTYTADRWSASHDGSGGTRTIARVEFSPGIHSSHPTMPEFRYQLQYRLTALPTSSTFSRISQKIASVRTAAGQACKISFWARCSATASDTMLIYLGQYFGSGGSPSSTVYTGTTEGSTVISNDNTWRRYSWTLQLPDINGKTLGSNNDDYLMVLIQFGDSSKTIAIDIAGIQLEMGAEVTDFEISDYAESLRACKYYFQSVTSYTPMIGTRAATGQILAMFPSEQMRANPTGSFATSGTWTLRDGTGTDAAGTIATLLNTTQGVRVTFNTSLVPNSNTACSAFGTDEFRLDAEL